MKSKSTPRRASAPRPQPLMVLAVFAVLLAASGAQAARPSVEFDFVRLLECRDVTTPERLAEYPHLRLIEIRLPISVRFRDGAKEEVDQIDVELVAAPAGLAVYDFSPRTTLLSDVAHEIETTTTRKLDQSIEGTLGGALPVPYGQIVAHVAPSVSAGAGRSETATEKVSRLPPLQPVVVSGTSHAGRGVFFKLKRSSQTSLEGVHELCVIFATPADWTGGPLRIACTASGRREFLWVRQSAILGQAGGAVQLYLAGDPKLREAAAERLQAERASSTPRPSLFEAAAAEMMEMTSYVPFERRAAPCRGGESE